VVKDNGWGSGHKKARKAYAVRATYNIFGIVFGHTGFLRIPPTFSHELESIGFSFKRTYCWVSIVLGTSKTIKLYEVPNKVPKRFGFN
jgi:hypothetical protein